MDKNIVLSIINNATYRGGGLRSHELYSEYAKETGEYPNHGDDRKVLLELKDEGKIKFVTETWKDYCWIVPANWCCRPRPGYINVEKVECNLFGI